MEVTGRPDLLKRRLQSTGEPLGGGGRYRLIPSIDHEVDPAPLANRGVINRYNNMIFA